MINYNVMPLNCGFVITNYLCWQYSAYLPSHFTKPGGFIESSFEIMFGGERERGDKSNEAAAAFCCHLFVIHDNAVVTDNWTVWCSVYSTHQWNCINIAQVIICPVIDFEPVCLWHEIQKRATRKGAETIYFFIMITRELWAKLFICLLHTT